MNHYNGIVLLISHDRVFLDRTVNTIFELDENKPGIRKFVGNYSAYAEQIQLEKQKTYENWKDQEAEIRRLKADWINTAEQARYSENSTKDSTMRRYAKKVAKKGLAKKHRLERYLESDERLEKPMDRWRININFAEADHQSQQILTSENLSFGYTDSQLFKTLIAHCRRPTGRSDWFKWKWKKHASQNFDGRIGAKYRQLSLGNQRRSWLHAPKARIP